MADDVFVTGPHRVDQPHPGLVDALTDLWGRATVAGASLGFSPSDAVQDVRTRAAEVIGEVTEKRASLLILGREHALVGAAVLRRKEPVDGTAGEIAFLTVDPQLADQGWEKKLYDAVLAQAQALGLEALELDAPGGQPVSGFHESPGWAVRGQSPEGQDRILLTREG